MINNLTMEFTENVNYQDHSTLKLKEQFEYSKAFDIKIIEEEIEQDISRG